MKIEAKKMNVRLLGFEVKSVSFTVNEGEFFSIVGPTGSGKSTILKAIAGLELVTSGEVFFDEKNVTKLEAEKRGVGFVFQNAALFPHLNVLENVAFGLRIKKDKNAEQKARHALEMVGLNGFEKRLVKNLSGGEAKLVAICRAIAFSPKILFLDEPLAGLDARLREKQKALIKHLQEKLRTTTIYVTHDIDEAFFLSDKIMVINDGEVQQVGSPVEIFEKPANEFVKDFVSDYALAEARIEKKNGKKVMSAKIEMQTSLPEGHGLINVKKNNYRKS